jgi:hypothetical protein
MVVGLPELRSASTLDHAETPLELGSRSAISAPRTIFPSSRTGPGIGERSQGPDISVQTRALRPKRPLAVPHLAHLFSKQRQKKARRPAAPPRIAWRPATAPDPARRPLVVCLEIALPQVDAKSERCALQLCASEIGACSCASSSDAPCSCAPKSMAPCSCAQS